MIKVLIEVGKASVNHATKSGAKPLYIAVIKGRLEMAQYLVREGRANVNHTCGGGATALFVAAQMGHLELVQCLYREGQANIDKTNLKGATPLLVSLLAKDVNIAVPRFLLSMRARVTSLDNPIFTGLTKAWIYRKYSNGR